MGSQMSITIQNISANCSINILILEWEKKLRVHSEFTLFPNDEKQIKFHFMQSPYNFISISIHIDDETADENPIQANLFTITSVADFCTFQLQLLTNYSNVIKIIETSPDFLALLKKCLQTVKKNE